MVGSRGFTKITVVSVGLCVLLPVGIVLVPLPAQADQSTSGGVWSGVELRDLDGKVWTAEDLLGKIVVLDFWATWCTPCLAELPKLRALDEAYGDDLLILGVALDSMERRDLRSFLRRHGARWPQIHRPTGLDDSMAEAWGVEAVPAVRIIDRQGRWVASDLRGRALELTVRRLITSP